MDRIGKYEDLNKKYMDLESRSIEITKEVKGKFLRLLKQS
jgi:hypothetical protein